MFATGRPSQEVTRVQEGETTTKTSVGDSLEDLTRPFNQPHYHYWFLAKCSEVVLLVLFCSQILFQKGGCQKERFAYRTKGCEGLNVRASRETKSPKTNKQQRTEPQLTKSEKPTSRGSVGSWIRDPRLSSHQSSKRHPSVKMQLQSRRRQPRPVLCEPQRLSLRFRSEEYCLKIGPKARKAPERSGGFLGFESLSILVNHRSFRKKTAVSFGCMKVCLKEGSLERMGKVP